jgi:hypothetical protein
MTKTVKPLHIKNHDKSTLHKLPPEQQPNAYAQTINFYESTWSKYCNPNEIRGIDDFGLVNNFIQNGYTDVFHLLFCYGSNVSEPWMLEQAVHRLRRLSRLAGSICIGATSEAPMQFSVDDFTFHTTPVAATSPFISDYYWKEWVGICLINRDATNLAAVLKYHSSWAKTSSMGSDEAILLTDYLKLAATLDARLPDFHEAHFGQIMARYDNVAVVLPVFLAVFNGDAEAFEQAIIYATEYRQRWYTKGVTRSPYDQFGILPALLIGAAALGFDRHGWQLQHKNEYIPTWWMENQFDDYLAQMHAGADLRAKVLGFPKVKFLPLAEKIG